MQAREDIIDKSEKDIEAECPLGKMYFRKNHGVVFGRKMIMIIRPHGDLGCYCMVCTAADIVSKYNSSGYDLVDIKEYTDHHEVMTRSARSASPTISYANN